MILSATGHRPDKLGGYGSDKFAALTLYATEIIPLYRPTQLVSGMALGWDQAIAFAAVELGIPFIAAIPFEGQESVWPRTSQRLYTNLLSHASHVEVICEGGFAGFKMQRRNEWMVDNSDGVLALWNGIEGEGGTANCVKYAQEKGRPVHQLWPGWMKIRAELSYEDFRERMLHVVTEVIE